MRRGECDQLQASARSAAERDKHRHCQLVLAEIVAFWNAYERSLAELRVGDAIFYRGTPVVVQLLTAEQVTLAAGSGHTRRFSISKATASLDSGLRNRRARRGHTCDDRGSEDGGAPASKCGRSGRVGAPVGSGTASQPAAGGATEFAGGSTSDAERSRIGCHRRKARFRPPLRTRWRRRKRSSTVIIDPNCETRPREPGGTWRMNYSASRDSLAWMWPSVMPFWIGLVKLQLRRGMLSSPGNCCWRCTARLFEIDVDTVTTTISLLNRRLQDPGVVLQLLERCELLVDQCIDAARYDLAMATTDSLIPVVRRSKNRSRIEEYLSLKTELRQMKERHEVLANERNRIRTNPADTAANDRTGAFMLQQQGNCDAAIPFLIQGSDSKLRMLAELELRASTEMSAAVQAADGWWEFAGKLNLHAAHRVRRHAKTLYESVQKSVNDAERARIQVRLDEYEALYPPSEPVWLRQIVGKLTQVKWLSGTRWNNLRFGEQRVVYKSSASGVRELPYRVDYERKLVEIADIPNQRIFLLRWTDGTIEALAVDSNTGDIRNRGNGTSP